MKSRNKNVLLVLFGVMGGVWGNMLSPHASAQSLDGEPGEESDFFSLTECPPCPPCEPEVEVLVESPAPMLTAEPEMREEIRSKVKAALEKIEAYETKDSSGKVFKQQKPEQQQQQQQGTRPQQQQQQQQQGAGK